MTRVVIPSERSESRELHCSAPQQFLRASAWNPRRDDPCLRSAETDNR